MLIASLQSYQNSALREDKEQCYARREQRNPSLADLLGGAAREHKRARADNIARFQTTLIEHNGPLVSDRKTVVCREFGRTIRTST